MEIDEGLRRNLIELIRDGKSIPISYKSLLFPIEEKSQEIELVYGCKERKEDILADTMSVPFQAVRKFGNVKEGEWHNKLIFGDNLQALKFMLKDPRIKGKVKLVYIDPPFATEEEFRGSQGEIAYQDKIKGAEFVEFLRKRLIFLRQLLAHDGMIFLHLDYRKVHYVKVVMDDVFGENNFINEIAVKRIRKNVREREKVRSINVGYDQILVYSKNRSLYINPPLREEKKPKRWHALDAPELRTDMDYKLFGRRPPNGRHWMWSKEKAEKAIEEGRLRPNPRTGAPEYLVAASTHIVCDSLWEDITAYSFKWKFPTEKKEELLARILEIGSEEGDLVLDCFAGSGTTGAVAEKLKRRWIMVDSSKLAIYTMVKRLFSLRQKIGNRGEHLTAKPFVLYNAGLYEDHGFILSVGEQEYKKFAMELFQVEPKDFEINGLNMDGILLNCPVKVFSQRGYLTEEYVDKLRDVVGEYLRARMFIIAPASRVYFLQDYIEKNGIRYYVLRIPYSIIDELHKQRFTRPVQPTSSREINQLIDAVGFDFIRSPHVKAEYYRRKRRDKLIDQELIVELKDFKAEQRSKDPIDFEDPKDALSMVLVDRNYNGNYFNMTDYFFKDQIEKEKWKARIPATKTGKKVMIIYLDVLGNEAIEVKSIKDFKTR